MGRKKKNQHSLGGGHDGLLWVIGEIIFINTDLAEIFFWDLGLYKESPREKKKLAKLWENFQIFNLVGSMPTVRITMGRPSGRKRVVTRSAICGNSGAIVMLPATQACQKTS